MSGNSFHSYALAASMLCISSPVLAATVSILPGAPSGGKAIELSVSDFHRVGDCGAGGSVVNDGCSVVIKNDPNASHASGRFDPPPADEWIDSQDIDELIWRVSSPTAFSSVSFALTDAHDQFNSHFTMSYMDEGVWEPVWGIPSKLPNGNLFWLNVDFGEAVTTAQFLFSTKVGAGYDGYGISRVELMPAPVPLPASAALLLAGVGGLAAFKRRRKAA